jgi:molybdopterin-binding protein
MRYYPLRFRIYCSTVGFMTHFRIAEAADLLGVSDDTIRRWVHDGILSVSRDTAGRQVVRGDELAARAKAVAFAATDGADARTSARNRFVGLVTKVEIEGLMAQVELQCGPFRVVSLMSAEAARELHLAVGDRGVAVVKATTVIVETHARES